MKFYYEGIELVTRQAVQGELEAVSEPAELLMFNRQSDSFASPLSDPRHHASPKASVHSSLRPDDCK